MGLIKPYTDKNAVKIVAFGIQFARRLSDTDIDILVDKFHKSEYFINEFNKIHNQEEISMTFTSDGIPKHSQSIGGVVCQKTDANDFVTWTLEINRDSIIIINRSYSRWIKIYEKVKYYISETLKLILDDSKEISHLTLEYLDEFEILEPNNKGWKKELFKEDCPYLLPNINELDEFWHINHGYFKNIDKLDVKLLDNIHINYFADEQDLLKNKINIRTQHKIIYNKISNYNEEELSEIFKETHDHSKLIFNTIINDNILNKFAQGEGE